MTDAARPIAMERLLAERAWVEALARRLVVDDATADDVVQQTWIAALERPPRDAGALRGWLSRVVRNAAGESRRRASRRARWEAMAPARAASPSPADVVAKADAHKRLVDSVMSLDEPYRSAVLLRFFEGLSTDEVARRCGVPFETARTRIKRALAMLRARLDREHGADGASWALALLPLAGAKRAVFGTAAGGGALMAGATTKTVLAAAALGALAGAFATRVAMSPGDASSADETPSRETAEATKPPPRRPPQPRHPADPTPSSAPADASSLARLIADVPVDLPPRGTGVVSGHATTADGRPLAGVVVRAVAKHDVAPPKSDASVEEAVRAAVVEAKWRAATTRQATSDATGAYALTGLSDVPYSVEATSSAGALEAVVPPPPNADVATASRSMRPRMDARALRPGATVDFVLEATQVPIVVLMPDGTAAGDKTVIRFGVPGHVGGTHPTDFRWRPDAATARVIPGTWTAFAEAGNQLRSAVVEFTTPIDANVPTLTLRLAPIDASLLAIDSKVKEGSVLWGLRWLRLRQAAGGDWGGPAATGAALLCFLGAGETHQAGSSREQVKNALKILRDRQDADGRISAIDPPSTLRDHAVAGVALAEAFALTGSRVFKEPAQKALAFAMKTRSPSSGWGRTSGGAEFDVETTAWMTMLVKSAQTAQLDVDKSVFDDVVAAIDRVTDDRTGRVVSGGTMSEEAATAFGVLARIYAGRSAASDPTIARGAAYLRAHLPKADAGRAPDLSAWYFGTLAAYQVGGDAWNAWSAALKTAVIDRQRAAEDAGDDRGSWDAAPGASAEDRVWATSLDLLCTEVWLRYGHVVGVK